MCIGALVAHRESDHWAVDALGAPHVGERTEKQLIGAFCDKIAELKTQLVTFNGNSFDLPVLRYRAMIHGVSAPGLAARLYFNRYTEDAVDLCDILSSFAPHTKASAERTQQDHGHACGGPELRVAGSGRLASSLRPSGQGVNRHVGCRLLDKPEKTRAASLYELLLRLNLNVSHLDEAREAYVPGWVCVSALFGRCVPAMPVSGKPDIEPTSPNERV